MMLPFEHTLPKNFTCSLVSCDLRLDLGNLFLRKPGTNIHNRVAFVFENKESFFHISRVSLGIFNYMMTHCEGICVGWHK